MLSMLRRSAVLVLAFIFLVPGQVMSGSVDDGGEGRLAIIDRTSSTFPYLWTLWGAFTIDDLEDAVPHQDKALPSDIWVVQFDGPISRPSRDALSAEGVSLLSYFPDFAYVVRLNGKDPNMLLRIPHVVGAVPFLSGLKCSPDLYNDLASSDRSVPPTNLLVDLFSPDPATGRAISSMYDNVKVSAGDRYIIGPPFEGFEGLLSLEEVEWVETYMVPELLNNVSREIMGVGQVYSVKGLDGSGQTVAIADTGCDNGVDDHSVVGDMIADLDGRVTLANWAGTSPDDTHSHGTHVAGSVAGNGSLSNGNIMGVAPEANIFFQGIASDSNSLTGLPSNLSLLFLQAYENGSRIHTNSWGSSVYGQYTSESRDVDWFMYHHPDMLILFSAGNSGMDYSPVDGKIDADSIGSPATAKNCLTVGASENYRLTGGYSKYGWSAFGSWKFGTAPISTDLTSNNDMGLAAFSSRGPTDDGRIKPDVVAPGTNILSLRSRSTSNTGWGTFSANSNYIFMGGTSMSTPLTAGAAALVRQYYNVTLGMDSPSAALIKATLMNGAIDMTPGQYGSSNPTTREINRRPDRDQGWGRVNVTESLYPTNGNLAYLDLGTGVETGENVTTSFRVTSSSKELRLTLAWSDYPGATYAAKELVNDIDLVLTAPDGTVYNGNDLTSPYNDARDAVNNVEGITVASPAVGLWKVRAYGYNIPFGPQHMALVGSGAMSNFSGTVRLDADYYSTDGDRIGIELYDQDAVGSGTVRVNVTSSTFPSGRLITLTEDGTSGRFTGEIWTHNSSTTDSAKVQVSHDDIIKVTYSDISPSGDFNDTATAKRPQRIFLWYEPEYDLVLSIGERLLVHGRGEPGTVAWWGLEDSGRPWRTFHDDGNSTFGDITSGDGNFSDIWYVPSGMTSENTLVIRVQDPFLGTRYYQQFDLTFNGSMPRFPKDLRASVVPEGNSLLLEWALSNETDLSYFNIYMNSSSGALLWDMPGWSFVKSTSGLSNSTTVDGLADGTEYSLRVSAVDRNGNESSPSLWFNATPLDSVPPDVDLLTTPRTIVGEVHFSFAGSPDLSTVDMEYYNDSNENGLEDDGIWMPVGSGSPDDLPWDTAVSAGGPGNMNSMFLRYRGSDEVPNVSNWTKAYDFRIDNTGPASVEIIDPPPRVTRFPTHSLVGLGEADGNVEVWINGAMQSDNACNGLGGFEFDLTLSEGLNTVNLSAYDEFGAGPTNRTYLFTLDTQAPTAIILVEDPLFIVRNIEKDGHLFSSGSFDNGTDANFTYIENITWEVEAPLSDINPSYGEELIDLKFLDLGYHNITLTVRDPAGNENWTRLVVKVIDNATPSVNISGSFVADEDVGYTYHYDVDDNDQSWHLRWNSSIRWYFVGPGDFERNYTTATAIISFPEPGQYNVTLWVTDGGNNTGSFTHNITVLDKTPPMGDVLGPSEVVLGIPVSYSANFTDNDRSFPQGASFEWNMSYLEGPPEDWWWRRFSGPSFDFNFTQAGQYNIRVTVLDASLNERTVQISIMAIGDLIAPYVIGFFPDADDDMQFSEDLLVRVRYSEKIAPGSVVKENIYILDDDGSRTNATLELKDDTDVIFIPEALLYGRTYSFIAGPDVRDLWGNKVGSTSMVNFTIRTEFSLVYPEGVFPNGTKVNFTGNETDFYNITLNFTNPVALSSLLNAVTIYEFRTIIEDGHEVKVKEKVSFFQVLPGPDAFSAIIQVPLSKGLVYEISISDQARDIFDYQLDRSYTWKFQTYLPPQPYVPTDDDDGGDDIPSWLLDPTLWIIIIVIIVVLIVLLVVVSRVRRRMRLDRIWAEGAEEEPRRKDAETPSFYEEEKADSPEPATTPVPTVDYMDLYGPKVTKAPEPPVSMPPEINVTDDHFGQDTGSTPDWVPPPPPKMPSMPEISYDEDGSSGKRGRKVKPEKDEEEVEWGDDEKEEEWGGDDEQEESWEK